MTLMVSCTRMMMIGASEVPHPSDSQPKGFTLASTKVVRKKREALGTYRRYWRKLIVSWRLRL